MTVATMAKHGCVHLSFKQGISNPYSLGCLDHECTKSSRRLITRGKKRRQTRIFACNGSSEQLNAGELKVLSESVRDNLRGTSIYLVGMMGCGKSSVGGALADVLEYAFCDTDQLIEQVAKKKIHEIFEEDGEDAFRDVETQILSQLSPYTRTVERQVSTGGGAVIRRKNWGYISHGVSVWIDVEIPELVRRLLENTDDLTLRPILAEAATSDDTAKALENKLNSLYSNRKGLYSQADIRLTVPACQEETEERIVMKILQELQSRLQEVQEKAKSAAESTYIVNNVDGSINTAPNNN